MEPGDAEVLERGNFLDMRSLSVVSLLDPIAANIGLELTPPE